MTGTAGGQTSGLSAPHDQGTVVDGGVNPDDDLSRPRKFGLTQIAFAKRPETKTRRIAKIVEQAAANIRPS